MKKYQLTKDQILTFQQAYEWSKLETPKYICFGRLPQKDKEFFAPFLQAGYIHKDTLKYTGVFRLTPKGISKFEELKNNL
jgi:hypothetical protein